MNSKTVGMNNKHEKYSALSTNWKVGGSLPGSSSLHIETLARD